MRNLLSLRRSRRFVRGGIGVLWLGLLGFQTMDLTGRGCTMASMAESATTSVMPADAMPMDGMPAGAMHHESSPRPAPRPNSHCDHMAMSGACASGVVAVVSTRFFADQTTPRSSQQYAAPRVRPSASDVAPDVPPPRA